VRVGDSARATLGRPAVILLGSAALLLMIAITNVAGLLLARGAARHRELAVRAALGASTVRLAMPFLIESMIVCSAGGILGVVFAQAGTALIRTYIPDTYSALDLSLDFRVLGFVVIITLLVGFGCGLIPAWRLSRIDVNTALKAEGGGGTTGRATHGFNATLVVLQIMLACVLLTAAGLFGRSLHKLRTFDAGFARDHLLTFTLDVGKNAAGVRAMPIYHRVVERLRTLPGTTAATFSAQMPLVSGGAGTRFKVPGYVPGANEILDAHFLEVGPQFFDVLGIPLRRGRDFNEADLASGAPAVAIIGETMARHFFGTENPIGRHFNWGPQSIEIIGVVPDMKSYDWVRETAMFTYYRPYTALDPRLHVMRFQLRASGDPHAQAAAVSDIVREIDPEARVLELRTLEEAADAYLLTERALANFSMFFSAFAVILSSLGLYGLLAHAVILRRREIGVRIALGAQTLDVVRLIVKQGCRLALLGAVMGVCVSIGLARIVSTMLYGVSASDPLSLGLAVGLLIAVAIAACALPARAAAKIDPLLMLKAE
jgi:predicted permease